MAKAKVKFEEFKGMSDVEIQKMLLEAKKIKVIEIHKLRNKQTHEQKVYHANKKLVAQLHTEMTRRKQEIA